MLRTNFVNDVWLTRLWRPNSWWLLMMFDWPDAGGWTVSKIAYTVRLVDSKLKTKYSQWCFCWPDPGGWTVDKRQWCSIDPMLEVEQLEAYILLYYIYIQVYAKVIFCLVKLLKCCLGEMCCLVKYVAKWWNTFLRAYFKKHLNWGSRFVCLSVASYVTSNPIL